MLGPLLPVGLLYGFRQSGRSGVVRYETGVSLSWRRSGNVRDAWGVIQQGARRRCYSYHSVYSMQCNGRALRGLYGAAW